MTQRRVRTAGKAEIRLAADRRIAGRSPGSVVEHDDACRSTLRANRGETLLEHRAAVDVEHDDVDQAGILLECGSRSCRFCMFMRGAVAYESGSCGCRTPKLASSILSRLIEPPTQRSVTGPLSGIVTRMMR